MFLEFKNSSIQLKFWNSNLVPILEFQIGIQNAQLMKI